MARSTTLLPIIPGLPAILTLLFAPRAEFRADAKRTRLTGAICGLGYDRERRNQSFYPEHDMEIAFDTEISLSVSATLSLITTIAQQLTTFRFCRMCYSLTKYDFG